MNRAGKFILIISLSISMILSCSFSVFARDYLSGLKIWYSMQRQTMVVQHDFETYELSHITNYSSLSAYIEDGNPAATDEIDDNYPTFIVCDTTLHTNSNAVPMTHYCIPLDEVSDMAIISNNNNNQFLSIIDSLMGLNTNTQIIMMGIQYRTLYQLGYRISAYTQTSYTDGNCYLYVLNKLKGSDRINFIGTVQETFNNYTSDQYVFYNLTRVDFNPYVIRDTNNNNALVDVDFDYEVITIPNVYPLPNTWNYDLWSNYYIYETHDCHFANWHSVDVNGETKYTFELYITGPDPYYILMQTSQTANSLSLQDTGITNSSVDCRKITMDISSNDLSQTNQILLDIKDLLSDLEIQEINNLYNNITNNYDVDINLTISDLIGDLSTNLHTFDTEDPDVNLTTSDQQKIGGFKIIFSNMIDTLNENNLGIFYFLPFILLIVGAVL